MKKEILLLFCFVYFLLILNLVNSQFYVATVNIQDAKIISQENNVIKVKFNINNRENIQPNVKYGVYLIQDGVIKDSKIYDEVLILYENSITTKEIIYEAPTYLDGEYDLWIISSNEDGLTLGHTPAGKISLHKSSDFLEINGCYLNVEGENNIFYLQQGIDIDNNEKLILTCEISNHFSNNIEFYPEFETYYRTPFGKLLSKEKGDKYIILSKETKNFSFTLPVQKEPQAYDVKLILYDNNKKIISNHLYAHYIVRGSSGTIQNILIDKDYYKKDDVAKITIFWTGSADNSGMPTARKNGTSLNNIYFDIYISNKNGEKCSNIINKKIEENENILNIEIPIIKDCEDPKVSISLSGNNKILSSKEINIETREESKIEIKEIELEEEGEKIQETEKEKLKFNILKILLIIVCFIIIFFIIIKLIKRKK